MPWVCENCDFSCLITGQMTKHERKNNHKCNYKIQKVGSVK